MCGICSELKPLWSSKNVMFISFPHLLGHVTDDDVGEFWLSDSGGVYSRQDRLHGFVCLVVRFLVLFGRVSSQHKAACFHVKMKNCNRRKIILSFSSFFFYITLTTSVFLFWTSAVFRVFILPNSNTWNHFDLDCESNLCTQSLQEVFFCTTEFFWVF